jgi:hypothetical protein
MTRKLSSVLYVFSTPLHLIHLISKLPGLDKGGGHQDHSQWLAPCSRAVPSGKVKSAATSSNPLLEAVSLPAVMFYNTGVATYVWI